MNSEQRAAHAARRARMCDLIEPPVFSSPPACADRDPELFFRDYRKLGTALLICAHCPVVAECLAHAMENHELGVWGGTTGRERGSLRRWRKEHAGLCPGCRRVLLAKRRVFCAGCERVRVAELANLGEGRRIRALLQAGDAA